MPWLLNEDQALKEKFAGLKVQDANAPVDGRPVKVRFRLPDSELGEMEYPMVIIDHAGISRDEEREIRGGGRLPYSPEGVNQGWQKYGYPEDSPLRFEEHPIPYNIDYNITVYSRKVMHDMLLTLELAQFERIPSRFGFLEIPQDGTVRRLDLLAGPEPDHTKDADGKRVYRQVYKVRVSSELFDSDVEEFIKVLSVQTNLTHYTDTYDIPLESLI